jgi:hypothetical protein
VFIGVYQRLKITLIKTELYAKAPAVDVPSPFRYAVARNTMNASHLTYTMMTKCKRPAGVRVSLGD